MRLWFILVGKFIMGFFVYEEGYDEDEWEYWVWIFNFFWMGIYEVM